MNIYFKFRDGGAFGLQVPEEYGGINLNYTEVSMVLSNGIAFKQISLNFTAIFDNFYTYFKVIRKSALTLKVLYFG